MKIPIKIISFTLLIAFFGLLSVGLVLDKTIESSQNDQSADCFGVGCGPVQHAVSHTFSLPDSFVSIITESFAKQDDLINIKPSYLARAPETPPPNSL